MTVLLLAVTGVLALLVVGVAALAVRLTRRVGLLEARLAASSDADPWSAGLENHASAHLDAPQPDSRPTEYVITHLGEPVDGAGDAEDAEIEAVPTVAPAMFADLVLRESVVKAAALAYGVRRGLAPANRNRIWFEMRKEVRTSRKRRRAQVRDLQRQIRADERAREGLA